MDFMKTTTDNITEVLSEELDDYNSTLDTVERLVEMGYPAETVVALARLACTNKKMYDLTERQLRLAENMLINFEG